MKWLVPIVLTFCIPAATVAFSSAPDQQVAATEMNRGAAVANESAAPLPSMEDLLRGAPANTTGGGTRGGGTPQECSQEQLEKGECERPDAKGSE